MSGYEYVQITISQRVERQIAVSVGLWAADPTKRSPRPVKRPWEHVYYLQAPASQQQVFAAIKGALEGLSGQDELPFA